MHLWFIEDYLQTNNSRIMRSDACKVFKQLPVVSKFPTNKCTSTPSGRSRRLGEYYITEEMTQFLQLFYFNS